MVATMHLFISEPWLTLFTLIFGKINFISVEFSSKSGCSAMKKKQ